VTQLEALPADEASPWRGRIQRAAIVAAATSPLLLAIVLELPVCPTAALLDVPCPGCGLTRATLAFARGDFATALRLHPLVPLLTPLYVGFVLTAAWTYVRGPRPGARSNPKLGKIVGAFIGVTLFLMLAVWALRFFGFFGGPVPIERFRGF
jgi:hypothetical protein